MVRGGRHPSSESFLSTIYPVRGYPVRLTHGLPRMRLSVKPEGRKVEASIRPMERRRAEEVGVGPMSMSAAPPSMPSPPFGRPLRF